MQRGTTKFDSLGLKGGTATAASGAATLNSFSGVVTSEALSTAAAGLYVLTLTNSKIEAGSVVLVSVALGTSTNGVPGVLSVKPSAGSVQIVVQNFHTSNAFNGTIKVSFLVVQQ